MQVFQGAAATRTFLQGVHARPFVGGEVRSLLFAPRCGWMNAQQMGATLLDAARGDGVQLLSGVSLRGVRSDGAGRVAGADCTDARGAPLALRCGALVDCAGPYARAVGVAMGGDAAALPLRNEVHAKAVLKDVEGAVPDEAPMMIWDDEIELGWSSDEIAGLLEMGGFEARLAAPLPAGAHLRPYPMGGGGEASSLLLLWEALHDDIKVAEPPPELPTLRSELFAELLLRALRPMVPALGSYLRDDGSAMPRVHLDGGYYTRCPDNLPLIGPLPGAPTGAYVCAGLSGYGVMAANAAGELLAQHVAAEPLPAAYAHAFVPERWLDLQYVRRVESGAVAQGLQI